MENALEYYSMYCFLRHVESLKEEGAISGNLLTLLKFRSEAGLGDELVVSHWNKARANTKYTSARIKNENIGIP